MKTYHNKTSFAAYLRILSTGALVLGTISSAQALEFSASGQVNRALTAVDNGEEADVGFVDNAGTNTRFRFTGEQFIDDDLTIGFQYEVAIKNNESNKWDVLDNGRDKGTNVDNRLANVSLKTQFGQLQFGKVHSAADGVAWLDYSGTTSYGGGNKNTNYAGGVSFMNKDGDNSQITLGDVSNPFNGVSRTSGALYTTPKVGGASVALGVYEGAAFDIAPRFETTFDNGAKLGMAASYVDSQRYNSERNADGSGKITHRYREYGATVTGLLDSGFNATAAYKHRTYHRGSDADNYFASLGYKTGKHAVAISYNLTNDFLGSNANTAGATSSSKDIEFSPGSSAGAPSTQSAKNLDSKAQAIGTAYVYNWNKYLKLFASYHHYMLDVKYDNISSQRSKASFQDIDQVYAGIYFKFF